MIPANQYMYRACFIRLDGIVDEILIERRFDWPSWLSRTRCVHSSIVKALCFVVVVQLCSLGGGGGIGALL